MWLFIFGGMQISASEAGGVGQHVVNALHGAEVALCDAGYVPC